MYWNLGLIKYIIKLNIITILRGKLILLKTHKKSKWIVVNNLIINNMLNEVDEEVFYLQFYDDV